MPSKRFVPILRFSVGTSYEEKCKFEESQPLQTHRVQHVQHVQDPEKLKRLEHIANAFNRLSSHDDTVERHRYTKPCHHVVRDPHGNFSTCTFPNCTYAHTLEQLQLPCCVFDSHCYRRPKVNTNLAMCRFKHSDETDDEYRSRMNVVLPDLPHVSEVTEQ